MNPTYLTAYTVPYFFEYEGEYFLAIGTEDGRTHLFDNIENNIYGLYNYFIDDLINDQNSIRSCPTIGDINNDNLPDLIRGNASGGIELFIGNEFNLQQKEEISINKKIDIFPNPSSGTFNIKHNINQPLTIQIFSITGKLISFLTVQDDNIIKIDNLKPGIYILKIKEDKQLIKTEKIIISK